LLNRDGETFVDDASVFVFLDLGFDSLLNPVSDSDELLSSLSSRSPPRTLRQPFPGTHSHPGVTEHFLRLKEDGDFLTFTLRFGVLFFALAFDLAFDLDLDLVRRRLDRAAVFRDALRRGARRARLLREGDRFDFGRRDGVRREVRLSRAIY
jgi:hypothetical protein